MSSRYTPVWDAQLLKTPFPLESMERWFLRRVLGTLGTVLDAEDDSSVLTYDDAPCPTNGPVFKWNTLDRRLRFATTNLHARTPVTRVVHRGHTGLHFPSVGAAANTLHASIDNASVFLDRWVVIVFSLPDDSDNLFQLYSYNRTQTNGTFAYGFFVNRRQLVVGRGSLGNDETVVGDLPPGDDAPHVAAVFVTKNPQGSGVLIRTVFHTRPDTITETVMATTTEIIPNTTLEQWWINGAFGYPTRACIYHQFAMWPPLSDADFLARFRSLARRFGR